MIEVVSIFVVVLISMIIVRVGTAALILTGLSPDVASFQAFSAYTGTGFTTREAELVMSHPLRRKIIRILILLGNMGLASVVAALILSFGSTISTTQLLVRIGVLVVLLVVLYILAQSKSLYNWMQKLFVGLLSRFTPLHIHDYYKLLEIERGFGIISFKVGEGSPLARKSLGELRLLEQGILVLGIHRADGDYLGAPHGGDRIQVGDRIICYGELDRLEEFAETQSSFAEATEEIPTLPSR